MKPSTKYSALTAVLVALAPSSSLAGEMNAALKIDLSNAQSLPTKFERYGSPNRDAIGAESDGLRIWLPERVEGLGQTGLYSYFALAGDCEVIIAYELLNVKPPQTGYGCGVGLAFDLASGGGRGDIQRVIRVGKESGFALHSDVAAKKKDADAFLPSTATRGRIGLRRVKKELIFLAADEADDLREIKRLPFTDATIRTVRLFADQGGSPTTVDVLIRHVEIRADEIAGGVAKHDVRTSAWWWLLTLIPLGGGLLLWQSRKRRQRLADDDV
jgi:hypothetical protein